MTDLFLGARLAVMAGVPFDALSYPAPKLTQIMPKHRRSRAELIATTLNEVGYDDRLIRREFPVWTSSGVVRHDLVAFGQFAPQDMTTATILARVGNTERAIEEALEGALNLACPAALVGRDEEVQLWSVSGEERHELVFSTGYDNLSELTSRFGAALSPHGLLGAKRLGRQMSLFPVDVQLLSSARANSAMRLSSLVLGAMDLTLGALRGSAASRLNKASELVVGVIAALVVRDKLGLESADNDTVIAQAQRLFPGYFHGAEVSPSRARLRDQLIELLGEGINYAGLDSAVVSDVYEGAVVSEAERLRLGIYYTPRWLADAIAKTLPFESIPPNELTVMDPSCGSGTFLLAAYDRISGLVPADWPPDRRHQFATSHLVGFDADEFAVEVARLSLLLHAMPAGNSWDVQHRDVLKRGIPDTQRPTVVLSNPPWKNSRSVGGKRHELADDFVRTALTAVRPGGFIGVVLPAAWLAGGTSRDTRRELSDRATVFEVWRLTDSTFGRSSLAPCVVFAQAKTPNSRRPFVFRRVLNRPGSMESFRSEGLADEQYLTYASASPDESLLRGPLGPGLEVIPSRRLRDVATIKTGPVPSPPVAERGTSPGNMWWLRSAADLIAFQDVPRAGLVRVRYPDEFHRAARVDPLLRAKKLLVSAKRSPENPWRIKAGLDLRGVIPRETLQMVVPFSREEDDLFAILALLGSAVASCWVDALAPKMVIEPEVLGALPIPEDQYWGDLARLGRRLSASMASDQGSSVRKTIATIDEVVAASYSLSEETVASIRKHMAGFTAPEGWVRFDLPVASSTAARETSSEGARRTVGTVLDVREGEVRLWVAGITSDEGDWVPLPSRMPGWLCSPGQTLEAIVRANALTSAVYEYQIGSHTDELDELVPLASGDEVWVRP